MKNGNLSIDEIINYIKYQNVFINRDIDKLYSRRDLREKQDISIKDKNTLEKILQQYNNIIIYIKEKLTEDDK